MLLILSAEPKTESSAQKTLTLLSQKLSEQNTEHTIAFLEDTCIVLQKGICRLYVRGKAPKNLSTLYFRRVAAWRDFAYVISQYAQKNNIGILDQFRSYVPFPTKMVQYSIFAQNNIPFPKTVIAGMWSDTHLYRASEELGFPLIAKQLNTSQGKGVSLIKVRDDLHGFFQKIPRDSQKNIILQEFIQNTIEYRILVLGGSAAVAETKKRQKGEFRNNVSLGATETFLPLAEVPQKILRLAENTATALAIDIAGVDILIDAKDDQPYVLEVNSAPQFTLDEKNSPELTALTSYLTLCEQKSRA